MKGVNASELMVSVPLTAWAELIEDSQFLECLRAAGVDNWSGYSDARSMFNEGADETDFEEVKDEG